MLLERMRGCSLPEWHERSDKCIDCILLHHIVFCGQLRSQELGAFPLLRQQSLSQQVATFILKGSMKDLSETESSEDDEDNSTVSGLHQDMAPAVNRLWRTFPAFCKLALPETTSDTGQH